MRQVKLEKVIDVFTLNEMMTDPVKQGLLLKQNQPSEIDEQVCMEGREEDLAEEIESWGFECIKPRWDLSCSQGSGACFSFENVNIDKLIDKYPDRNLAEELDNAKNDGFENTWLYLKDHDELPIFKGVPNSFANHYTHEKTMDVVVESSIEITEYDETATIVNEVIVTQEWEKHVEDIRKEVEKIYYDACFYLYRKLSSHYDWLHSKEAIIENLKANGDTEFTADGRCFKPDIFDYPSYTITDVVDNQGYVILNQDGKLWCSVKQYGCPDHGVFLDVSDEPDLGESKAKVFVGKSEAYTVKQNLDKIFSSDTIEIMLASEAFKNNLL